MCRMRRMRDVLRGKDRDFALRGRLAYRAAMHPLANRRYLKMNGLGNEIVVLDLRGDRTRVGADDARAIAAAPGSRFDQLMVLHDARTMDTDAHVRIYNADGSEAGACGNGTRCVGWAMMADPAMGAEGTRPLTIETKGGLLPIARESETVFTVDMGPPKLNWQDIPLRDPFFDTTGIELQIGPIDAPILHTPGVVSMGNPHAVFFVDDPYAYQLEKFGPLLENHPIFPDRANISLAAVPARDRIILRVWERGAGITKACGSGPARRWSRPSGASSPTARRPSACRAAISSSNGARATAMC